ncbi:MAG: protein-L-isoaspartate O-methyltransferase [Pseudomonadota bacterium]
MTDFASRRTMMVDTQVRPADVTKFPIIDAMLTVPRELFVPLAQREAAYLGDNLALGGGRVVLDPRTFAKMLDALNVGQDDVVLDIGTGLGYSAAVLARLAEVVVALEEVPEFARDAGAALSEVSADNAAIVEGPLSEGAGEHGPYDVILIQGGIETLPDRVAEQLKDGGRIAALFMEGALGTCRIGYRLDGSLSWRFAFNAAAPVLTGFETHATFAL